MEGFTPAIKRDLFDARAFERMRHATDALSAYCSQQGETGETFAGDVFSSLFKMTPKVNAESTAPHKPLIESMMEMPEWAGFRETTRLDQVASALATAELALKLSEQLPRDAETGGTPGPLGGAGGEDRTRRILRQAVKDVRSSVEEQMDAYAAMGCGSGSAEAGKSDPTAVVAMHRKIRDSVTLRRIAKLAGRMKRIAARKHRDRVRHGPDELADVETGRDLARVLPTELMALGTAAELDFLRKYAEGQLLQYRIDGRESKGQGPLVLLVDRSGSMAGEREVWAKALAVGLMTIAAKERRDFVMIPFDDATLPPVRLNKPSQEQVIDAISFACCGGTSFDAPLNAGMDAVESSAFRKADLVMLTDGNAHLSDATRERLAKVKKDRGCKLLTVLIGASYSSLDTVSDGLCKMSRLDKDAEALDLVFSV